jgi:zinc protease
MRFATKSAVFVVLALGALLARQDLLAAETTTRAAPRPLSVSRFIADHPDERIAVLSNGLTVILKAHRTAPVAAVRMYCKTGSVYEQEFAGAGISHLFEHLLHGGATTTRSEAESRRVLDEIGDNTNAYTSYGMTCYFINTSKENLGTAVDLLSDWITHPTFPDQAFKREWGVVQRELERDIDEPNRQMNDIMMETMYLEHPVRFPVIGHKQAVQSLTKGDIVAYYHRMYVPDNVIVSIAGDIDLRRALEVVERDFASFERRPVKTITLPEEPEMTTPRTAIKRMNVQSALLTLAWPSIRLTAPDLYALDLLSFVLTEGESSRLVRALVREQQLAFTVESYSWTPEWARGLFVVSARLDPKNVEPATAAIWTEIRRLQAELVSDEELNQAKRQKVAEHVFGHQTAEQIAEAMAQDFMATGDAHFSDNYVARIQEVTEDQLRDVARRYLRPECTGTMLIVPEGEAASETQSRVERISPTRMIRLDNGLRVVLRRDTSSPLVAMQMYCLGGLVTEDPSNNGISNIMAELLLRGTQKRSAEEIARFFDSRGASIDAGSGNNTFYVRCDVLKENFDEALDVFADVVQHPTFPADELDRIRPRVLNAISRIDESWRTELDAYFRSRFFSRSPYRMLAIGSADAVRRIDPAALTAYFRRFAMAPNMVLAIFGDIDEAKTEQLVRSLFAKVPAKTSSPRPTVAGEPPIERETLFIKKAPSERKAAGIYMGFRGTDVANTRDRYPLAVLDTILGGYSYPGGWLQEALRGGDRDLVYEVHDLNFFGIEPGYFGIYAACQPEKVNEVYRIIAEKVDRARAGKFEEAEFKEAKGIILATDLMQSRTNSDRASQAATDELYGLGFNHREQYSKYIESVTMEDVRRVAKQYVTKPIVVVVTPDSSAVKIGVEPTAIDESAKRAPAADAAGGE